MGVSVAKTQLLTAGNARLTAILVLSGGQQRKVVLRHDNATGSLANTPFTLAREAEVYAALQKTDLPVPRLLAEKPDRRTLLLEWMEGRVDKDTHALDDYLRLLGCLHASAIDDLHLPNQIKEQVAELGVWERIYSDLVTPQRPAIDLAFSILKAYCPSPPDRMVLCHGDAGPGNYLCKGAHVTALLDWELAHVGDPMDDLAWITVRVLLSGTDMVDFRERVNKHYVPNATVSLDQRRFRYWQAMACLRMLIMCLTALSRPSSSGARFVQISITPILERQLISLLAELSGVHISKEGDFSASQQLDQFPSCAIQEIHAQLGHGVLPLIADTQVATHVRQMRMLLRQILAAHPAERSHLRSSSEDRGNLSLRDLALVCDQQLSWFPESKIIAYRALPRL